MDPLRHPAYLRPVLAGLGRLGLLLQPGAAAAAETVYASLLRSYERLRSLAPALTALHLDHFLTLVAAMQGRSLWPRQEEDGDV